MTPEKMNTVGEYLVALKKTEGAYDDLGSGDAMLDRARAYCLVRLALPDFDASTAKEGAILIIEE